MKLPRYRRQRWILAFALLFAVALALALLGRRPQLVVYNDLETPLAGAVLRTGDHLVPIPPLAPGASVALPGPRTAGPADLLLADTPAPLAVGWINPEGADRLTVHIMPGPTTVVSTSPTLAGRVRRWLN
ncbi:MAG: hypothetical protein KF897_02560 [Opitutaceae bacterium]|nr:hypothetical protein [Opitutaceae bacterium]